MPKIGSILQKSHFGQKKKSNIIFLLILRWFCKDWSTRLGKAYCCFIRLCFKFINIFLRLYTATGMKSYDDDDDDEYYF